MPLTDTAIRNAKPAAKSYKLTDGGGLFLLVAPATAKQPKGGKWWRYKYRFGGKEKLLSLGTYPDTGLANARDKHAAARKMLAAGIDPSAERQDTKRQQAEAQQVAADTFEAVTRAWMATPEQQALAEVTKIKSRWLFETFLFPEVGHLPLAAITPRVLLDALRKIEASGKLETARRCKIKAGQVFRFAVLEGKVGTDPTAALRGAIKRVKHKHHAAITDPAEIGPLLRAIDGYTGQAVTVAAFKLAPLTFVRPGELRAAEWAEFDLDGAIWRVPAERMKMKAPHLVALSTQAVAILRELHRLTGHGRYVFPGLRTASRPMSENTINAALRRLGFDKDTMTGHGFRAMASSRLNEMGWDERAIERQLSHTETNEVKGAYNYAAKYLEARRRMMQAWADYLDGLRAGGQVVAFKSKAS